MKYLSTFTIAVVALLSSPVVLASCPSGFLALGLSEDFTAFGVIKDSTCTTQVDRKQSATDANLCGSNYQQGSNVVCNSAGVPTEIIRIGVGQIFQTCTAATAAQAAGCSTGGFQLDYCCGPKRLVPS